MTHVLQDYSQSDRLWGQVFQYQLRRAVRPPAGVVDVEFAVFNAGTVNL